MNKLKQWWKTITKSHTEELFELLMIKDTLYQIETFNSLKDKFENHLKGRLSKCENELEAINNYKNEAFNIKIISGFSTEKQNGNSAKQLL